MSGSMAEKVPMIDPTGRFSEKVGIAQSEGMGWCVGILCPVVRPIRVGRKRFVDPSFEHWIMKEHHTCWTCFLCLLDIPVVKRIDCMTMR